MISPKNHSTKGPLSLNVNDSLMILRWLHVATYEAMGKDEKSKWPLGQRREFFEEHVSPPKWPHGHTRSPKGQRS